MDRRNKSKYNFKNGSLGSFIAKTGGIFIIINLFMLWLSAANGLPYILIILTVLILIYSFITAKTVAGRHIYALGGNEKAAALSGSEHQKGYVLGIHEHGFTLRSGRNSVCRQT